jgi:hypothetical protein
MKMSTLYLVYIKETLIIYMIGIKIGTKSANKLDLHTKAIDIVNAYYSLRNMHTIDSLTRKTVSN